MSNTDNTTTVSDTTTQTTSERFLGLVKWFTGGHGFITNFDTKEDVFVHHSNLTTNVDCWKRLYPGDYVEFSVGSSDSDSDKTEAKDVTGVRRGPLRCETNALLRREREEYNQSNNTGTDELSGRGRRRGRNTRGRNEHRSDTSVNQ